MIRAKVWPSMGSVLICVTGVTPRSHCQMIGLTLLVLQGRNCAGAGDGELGVGSTS